MEILITRVTPIAVVVSLTLHPYVHVEVCLTQTDPRTPVCIARKCGHWQLSIKIEWKT